SLASPTPGARRRTSMTHTSGGRFRGAARWLLAPALAAAVAAPVALRAGHNPVDGGDRGPGALTDRNDSQDRDENRGGNSDTPVHHLVVIFQENVSFDHYFATYPHAANTDGPMFTAKPGTPLVNGLFPGGLLDHNPNTVTAGGSSTPAQPFRLSHAQAVTCDQDHNYPDEQRAFNAGLMNRLPDTV